MRKRILVLALVPLATMFCVLAWYPIDFIRTCRQTRKSFVASRPGYRGSIDSYEFVSHGVKFGDSEAEVDRLMQAATERSGRLVGPPTKPGEFLKIYYFEYKPTYDFPLAERPLIIIFERFCVLFDERVGAIRLDRSLFMRGDRSTGITYVDLKNKTMSNDVNQAL